LAKLKIPVCKSTDVVDIVRRFNAANMPIRQYVAGGVRWHGYDVERLYTNIEIDDLVHKLHRVMEWAWHQHAPDGHYVVQVFGNTCQQVGHKSGGHQLQHELRQDAYGP
jgi:hypothetical protein